MDKISEFFKELKDRASNPLFFSFITGWLITNWKILIGLLFYTISELQIDGYSSYFDLIKKESNFYHSLLYPFLISLGYTFLFPIIRNGINIFNAWNQKWGTNKTLQISKDGKISVSRYIQLREIYEKRKLTIEEVLEKESQVISQNENLKSQIKILEKKLDVFEKDTQFIKQINDMSVFLEGDWLFRVGTSEENTRVNINKGHVFLNTDYQKSVELYRIENIAYNTFTFELIIIINDLQKSKIYTEVFSTQPDYKLFRNKSNRGSILFMRRDD